MDKYNGGIIDRACPHCGHFCKVPDYYIFYFKVIKNEIGGLADIEIAKSDSQYMHMIASSYADSYCNRCKKDVKLIVKFIKPFNLRY